MLGLNGKGKTVYVISSRTLSKNPFGEPVKIDSETPVENVLIAPGKTSDVNDENRPEGVIVAYTLHFPKTYSEDLTGCKIKVPNGLGSFDRCAVIGSPRPTMTELTPGDWHMPVEVMLVDG